jgi:ribosomal protein S18 acetylase RimI-like enzyme
VSVAEPVAAPALSIAAIEDGDVTEVIALWQRCGSTRAWNDPAGDIALARKETNATVLLGRRDGVLLASVLVGHDGHRGWVYYVTVDPDHRHQGYGREIMAAAEHWLRARGIEKLQLMVRGDNAKVHAFYRSIGYYDQERVVFAKWLDGREPTP